MKIVKGKLVFNFQSGQVLLITLLIMVVGLTVGLAVIARSVTSVKISTQEEESQRAFYAAEAGLEELLLPGASIPTGPVMVGDASYTLIVGGGTEPGGQKFTFKNLIEQDETQPVWLVGHDVNGEILAVGVAGELTSRYPIGQPIDICWSNPDSGDTPAMEITIIHQRTIGSKEYGVARGAYDPEGSRRYSNKFSNITPAPVPNCSDYQYSQRISFATFNLPGYNPGNPSNSTVRVVALRLRPIYNDAKVAVVGSSPLPPQGKEIESLGQAGTAQRKLKVFRAYPSFPSVFDYVLFSGTPLSK